MGIRFPYRKIFRAVEKQVVREGSRRVQNASNLFDRFRHFENRALSDNDYFSILVFVTFYSGFKADTFNEYGAEIRKQFGDWKRVAEYTHDDVRRLLRDRKIIANRRKVIACITNAKRFGDIIGRYGSIQKFIESYEPGRSFANLALLKERLESAFSHLGKVTVYHFMTDIGLRVLKPDRVVCRIFKRLGLITSEDQLLSAVVHGRKFADATGEPIRYIDKVFVAFGQAATKDLGITRGICLKRPRCGICDIAPRCLFAKEYRNSMKFLKIYSAMRRRAALAYVEALVR
jgi:DNA-3-methyladenine glycosylase I